MRRSRHDDEAKRSGWEIDLAQGRGCEGIGEEQGGVPVDSCARGGVRDVGARVDSWVLFWVLGEV